MQKKPLYIPTPVPDTDDVIKGFGVKEIAIIAISSGIALVVILISVALTGNMFNSIMFPGGALAIVIVAVRKDIYCESFIDKLRYIQEFSKVQKNYEYQYYNFIEQEIDKMERVNHDSK